MPTLLVFKYESTYFLKEKRTDIKIGKTSLQLSYLSDIFKIKTTNGNKKT